MSRLIWLLALAVAPLLAQPFTIYVGDLNDTSVLLAWGQNGEGNTIGRDAKSYGKARVQAGERTVETDRACARVSGLQPDTVYSYKVEIGGRTIGQGKIRTWARKADNVTFLVIGDWGRGSEDQRQIAREMIGLVNERQGTANPVRFVLSTGDNIYRSGIFNFSTGAKDEDWWPKFFEPYAEMIKQIPMFLSLGNHDGNESENRDDLPTYLDNMWVPGRDESARWYRFSYGGLADFFALDSTQNTESGPLKPAYLLDGEQSVWLKKQLAESRAPWKIPFYHHPVFNAGPRHDSKYDDDRVAHWIDVFAEGGVKAVFQGHEHNYQVSEANQRSKGIRFFVSGAGGELRRGNVVRRMAESNIAMWAPQRHFLLVEIRGKVITVEPRSFEPMKVVDASGQTAASAVRIELP